MNKIWLILFLVFILTGCQSYNEHKENTVASESQQKNDPPTETSKPKPDDPPSEYKDQQASEPTTESNIFDPQKVKVGDQIGDLRVLSIEFDTFDTGSIFIDFAGEIELIGTYEHYSVEEITDQNYSIYFTIDNQSLTKLPRINQENMNYSVVIGIENKADAEKILGPPGTEGKATILFSNYKIRSAPSKPIEDVITFVRLVE
jgi:hypothetical protein